MRALKGLYIMNELYMIDYFIKRLIQAAGYLIPDTGHRIPDTGYLTPDTGYLIPETLSIW